MQIYIPLTRNKIFVILKLDIRKVNFRIMITLSIDASTKSSGIAIFNEGKLIYYECITSSSTNTYKRIEIMTERIR